LCIGKSHNYTKNKHPLLNHTPCSIFKQSNKFSVFDINKFQIIKFIFQVLNNLSPPCFADLFTRTSSVHTHKTRSEDKNNLFLRQAKTNFRKFGLSVRGPQIWNELPITLKSISSPNVFYKNLKKHFMTMQN